MFQVETGDHPSVDPICGTPPDNLMEMFETHLHPDSNGDLDRNYLALPPHNTL